MLNIYTKNNNHAELPAAAAKSARANKLSKYEEPTDTLSGNKLQWAEWYVRHRLLLYRILAGTLAVFSAVTLGYSLIYLGYYLLVGYNADQALQNSLASTYDYAAINARYTAAPLRIAATDIFAGGVKKYDAVAQIKNPNERFTAYFDYYFVVGGVATPRHSTLLLPGEERPVAAFGLDGAGSVSAVLENVRWKRVSAHEVNSVSAFQADHLNFAAVDFQFVVPQGENAPSAHAIQFNLKNDSPFGYAQADFVVGLYQGGALAGVMPLTLKNFQSLETRAVDLRSFVSNLFVTEVKVFPVIDIYDPGVYIQPPK